MQTGLETQLFFFFVLILSIIIHEVAHGYAANALGDPTAKLSGRLTLNPAAHIDFFGSIVVPGILLLTHAGILFGWAKPVPYNPYNLKNQRWGEAIVGVAGVATNLLLALVFAVIARTSYAYGLGMYGDLASIIVLVNLFLGLFNLIPFPPLDGYTVLRGILPYRAQIRFRAFEDRMRQGGIITLILILFIFSTFLVQPFSTLVYAAFHALIGA